jgi:beta-1,4-mannooligosaccharide/beta-1,4-mannosyl-N-acetylglucosamine phosphorylase
MKRHEGNPILTRADIPPVNKNLTDVTSVFNPGAVRFRDVDRLLLRVQTRGRETVLMPAERTEGERLRVTGEVTEIEGLDPARRGIFHVYDPRLTEIAGVVYVVFAADTDDGCRLGIARSEDFRRFELVSFDESGDRRNGVLFSERVGGRYLRLERPNESRPSGSASTGSRIMLAESDDLETWHVIGPVMEGRRCYWDEWIGSGPPPIKTREGWLHIYHGVATHFASCNIYQAGVVLLDLNDPSHVLARGRRNILEPREPYELVGQVPNVVFPSGAIVNLADDSGFADPDAEVLVYYGAADTCVAQATTTVRELLDELKDD